LITILYYKVFIAGVLRDDVWNVGMEIDERKGGHVKKENKQIKKVN
jgi:hypothetical protein